MEGIHRESPRCAPGTLLIQCRLHKTKKHTVTVGQSPLVLRRYRPPPPGREMYVFTDIIKWVSVVEPVRYVRRD